MVWDVDGTLVDTADLHFQAWLRLARELDRPFNREQFVATFGQRNPDIIRRLFDGSLTDLEVARIGERKEEFYWAEARKGVDLLPGARSLLEGLQASGFKQAVGSSAPRQNLDLILEITGTRRFFDAIVSMENTQRGKPDPQVFLIAARKLSVPPARCVVMEDAVAGVEAARAAGMKCVAVRFVGHHPRSRLEQAGADRAVDSLEEVTAEDIAALLEA